MSSSHTSLKQKDSRSSIHYFFRRSFSHLGIRSTGRKRRFFIASVITFSGVLLQHILPHSNGSRQHTHPSSINQAPRNNQSGTVSHYAFSPSLYVIGALLLALSKVRHHSSTTENALSVLFVTTQGIRGSPTPATP